MVTLQVQWLGVDPSAMAAGSDVVAQERYTALARMLERHPGAPISGLSAGGAFIDPPDDLRGAPFDPAGATNPSELVLQQDRPAVAAAIVRLLKEGFATARCRLHSAPERYVSLQFANLQRTHGALVMVVLPDAEERSGDVELGVAFTPRYGTLVRDELSNVLRADDGLIRMLGWSVAQLAEQRGLELIHPDDHERALDSWLEMLTSPGRASRWRGRYRRADGAYLWVEVITHNRLSDPDGPHVLSEMTNIDEEMAVQEQLRISEKQFRELSLALPVGVMCADGDGRVVFANRRLHEITRGEARVVAHRRLHDTGGEEGMRDLAELAAFVAVRDRHLLADALDQIRHGAPTSTIEVQLRTGSVCQLGLRAMDGGGVIICVTDVSDGVRLREELRVQATIDVLTGCRNRAATVAQLEALLRDPAEGDVGILFVDLDGFKPINDRYGHGAGDEVLTLVSRRLQSCARSADLVGRLGGDEFVLLQRNADEASLRALAERVWDRLNGELSLAVATVPLAASVGAHLAPNGSAVDEALAAADAAMYEAKHAGGRDHTARR